MKNSCQLESYITAQVYRLSIVYCQVIGYSDSVSGYVSRYSECQLMKSRLTKKKQPIRLCNVRPGSKLFSISICWLQQAFEGVLFKIWHWNMAFCQRNYISIIAVLIKASTHNLEVNKAGLYGASCQLAVHPIVLWSEHKQSPVNSPHKGQWRGALIFLWSAPE